MSQNNFDRVETEKCVENIVKKTIIGYVAPLSLFLIVRNGRFVHNTMLLGAGFGLGHSINDCSTNPKCSFRNSLFGNNCNKSTACCSTNNKCTKNNNTNTTTTITTEAQE